jgi:hypothetical protein
MGPGSFARLTVVVSFFDLRDDASRRGWEASSVWDELADRGDGERENVRIE